MKILLRNFYCPNFLKDLQHESSIMSLALIYSEFWYRLIDSDNRINNLKLSVFFYLTKHPVTTWKCSARSLFHISLLLSCNGFILKMLIQQLKLIVFYTLTKSHSVLYKIIKWIHAVHVFLHHCAQSYGQGTMIFINKLK